jgi:hyperosmotically inducible protein
MNVHKSRAAAVLTLLAVAGVAGCNRGSTSAMADKAPDQIAAQTGSAAANQGGKGAESSDGSITTQVKDAFAGQLGDQAAQIQVDTIGGTVILSGTVDSKAGIDKAQQLAAAVPGVKAIDNRLAVKAGGVG